MKKNYYPIISTVILAILIGFLTGSVSILFKIILDKSIFLIANIYTKTPIFMIIIPLISSLLIGIIRSYLLHGQNQGFSVSQVMYEIEHINYVVMKPLDVFYKFIGTILSLLAGFSVGRQGPMVHIGGAIGSNISYFFKRNEDETRVLIGCGVAGCLAGTFNTPLFATLFVVEILFKKRYFDMISTILLSAISSTLLVKVLTNDYGNSSFEVFNYNINEIINFAILGLIIGIVSITYTYVLRKTNSIFIKSKLSYIAKSLIGGLVIGLSLLFLSKIYTYNINPIQVLNSNKSICLLLLSIITYILLTSISISSGAMGGIFTPGLFIGATSGLLIAKILQILNVNILNPKTYIVIGISAMFSGFANAPLTAVILIIEFTGQYKLLVPALLASLTSSIVTDFVYKNSIYHLNLIDLLENDIN